MTNKELNMAICPMPPPGYDSKLLPLQGERGAPMITQGDALGLGVSALSGRAACVALLYGALPR